MGRQADDALLSGDEERDVADGADAVPRYWLLADASD